MSCVLLDPPSHKVGHAQQQSIVKWLWYIGYQAQAGPECTSKIHEEIAHTPMVSTFATVPPAAKPIPTDS